MRTLIGLIVIACFVGLVWFLYNGIVKPNAQNKSRVDALTSMGVAGASMLKGNTDAQPAPPAEDPNEEQGMYTFSTGEEEKVIEEVFIDGDAQHNYADILEEDSEKKEEDPNLEKRYTLNAEQQKKLAAYEKKFRNKRWAKEDLFTGLMDAVYFNDIPKVIALINKGAPVDSSEANSSFTPIFMAISNGNANMLAMLIDKGASFEIYDDKGHTPLHRVITQEDYNSSEPYPTEEIIEVLLENGADINKPTRKGGLTPLMLTAQEHKGNTMKYLLENGANDTTTDDSGLAVLDYAKRYGCTSCMRILLD